MNGILRLLFVSGMLAACLGVMGCVEESGIGAERPRDTDGDGIGLVTLSALAREGTVRARWTQGYPNSPDLYYRVSWTPVSRVGLAAGDTGSQFVYWFDEPGDAPGDSKTFMADIVGLNPKLYEITLEVFRRGSSDLITHTSMQAAPAQRYYYEADDPSAPLRLHEVGSRVGRSGLVIDPRNGVRSVRMEDAQPGTVQLVVVEGPGGEPVLQIASTTEWGASGKAHPEFITMPDDARGYRELNYWAPLDDWWFLPPGPIDTREWVASSRFIFVQNGGRGLFLLGDPASSEWRLVRISTVRGTEERYLRGAEPERYMEIEISLGHPGVPFA